MDKISLSDLVRWSGLSAVVVAVLVVIAEIGEFSLIRNQSTAAVGATSPWTIIMLLYLLAFLFGLWALTGLYIRQLAESGLLGLVAFLVAFAGTALGIGFTWTGLFVVPSLANMAPEFLNMIDAGEVAPAFFTGFLFSNGLFGLGWLLFGLASYRAQVFSRGASIFMAIAGLVNLVFDFMDIPFSGIIFGIALVWLAYPLWRGAAETPQAASV